MLTVPEPNLTEKQPRQPEVREIPEKPSPRVVLTPSGLRVGDYMLVPTLVLSTDNRYDDVNLRERMLRDQLDEMASHQHGEVHEDPISQLLKRQDAAALNQKDPGIRLVLSIHQILQGSLHIPNFIRRLPLPEEGAAAK